MIEQVDNIGQERVKPFIICTEWSWKAIQSPNSRLPHGRYFRPVYKLNLLLQRNWQKGDSWLCLRRLASVDQGERGCARRHGAESSPRVDRSRA